MHIPEFEGMDADSWIQVIERYFDAARTPLEQRTEIATTYLKGPAIQWWRGTGIQAGNLPWHRFCRLISDRFAESSVCDNVRSFHALTQTSKVSLYILQFEQLLNLMRRDNPALPDDYYMNSFISGLTDYIQHHLQCHKPKDMSEAMWMARRIEQANSTRRSATPTYQNFVKRQIPTENPKQQTPLATVIQQAKIQGVCYKCKEPWFPGHKPLCKMNQKAQVNALQAESIANNSTVYIIETDEGDIVETTELPADQDLAISMHAILGISDNKYTFTVNVLIGDQYATALVDTGSTTTFMTPQFAEKAKCHFSLQRN